MDLLCENFFDSFVHPLRDHRSIARVRPPFVPPPPRKAQWSLVSFHVAHLHVIYLDILVMRSNRTAGVWFLLALHAHSDSLSRIPWINFSFACCYLLKFQIASDVCDSSWCPFKCAAVLISEIPSLVIDIFQIFSVYLCKRRNKNSAGNSNQTRIKVVCPNERCTYSFCLIINFISLWFCLFFPFCYTFKNSSISCFTIVNIFVFHKFNRFLHINTIGLN